MEIDVIDKTTLMDYQSDEVKSFALESAKEMFYQCKFTDAVELINSCAVSENNFSNRFKLVMLKSKCLFELNRRDLAKIFLEEALPAKSKFKNADYFYIQGSISYFDGDFQEAQSFFQKMLDSTDKSMDVFKALLALGNVAYNQGKEDESFTIMMELKKLSKETILDKDIELSFDLFCGTILLYNKVDFEKARGIFENCFNKSIELGWTFFSQRCLYNLAKWYKLTSKVGESQGILKVLDIYLSNSDSRFLSHLVNTEFIETDHRSSQRITVCTETKSVTIGHNDKYTLVLKKWPLLFKMLFVLHSNKGFVSKAEIAEELWPNDKYLPKTYDPRIYDIVARLKKRIDLVEQIPLLIEAGIDGYKLNRS